MLQVNYQKQSQIPKLVSSSKRPALSPPAALRAVARPAPFASFAPVGMARSSRLKCLLLCARADEAGGAIMTLHTPPASIRVARVPSNNLGVVSVRPNLGAVLQCEVV